MTNSIPVRKKRGFWCKLGFHKWIRKHTWSKEVCEKCGRVAPEKDVNYYRYWR